MVLEMGDKFKDGYQLRRIGPPASLEGVKDVMRLNPGCSKFGRSFLNGDENEFYLDSARMTSFISRRHAEIYIRENGDCLLVDLGMNGTYINDIRVDGRCTLRPDDKVIFGHKNGININPGTYITQPTSEFQFIFEKVSSPSKHLKEVAKNNKNFKKYPNTDCVRLGSVNVQSTEFSDEDRMSRLERRCHDSFSGEEDDGSQSDYSEKGESKSVNRGRQIDILGGLKLCKLNPPEQPLNVAVNPCTKNLNLQQNPAETFAMYKQIPATKSSPGAINDDKEKEGYEKNVSQSYSNLSKNDVNHKSHFGNSRQDSVEVVEIVDDSDLESEPTIDLMPILVKLEKDIKSAENKIRHDVDNPMNPDDECFIIDMMEDVPSNQTLPKLTRCDVNYDSKVLENETKAEIGYGKSNSPIIPDTSSLQSETLINNNKLSSLGRKINFHISPPKIPTNSVKNEPPGQTPADTSTPETCIRLNPIVNTSKRKTKETGQTGKRIRLSPAEVSDGVTWYEGETCASLDCKRPNSVRIAWVQCDSCDDWYHTACVGCNYKQVKNENIAFQCGCI